MSIESSFPEFGFQPPSIARADTQNLAQAIGDQITQQLRHAIVTAELLPGQKLKQLELARQFGTSRVPLREAMRQLTGEGLIQWTSNRTAIVSRLSFDELKEQFELAALLEARATSRGVPLLSDEDIERLGQLNAEIAGTTLDARHWYEKNLAFHMIPMQRSGQQHGLKLVLSIRANLLRFFLIPEVYGAPDADLVARHLEGHERLMAAFRQRDGVNAGQLVQQDWLSEWAYWEPRLGDILTGIDRELER